MNERLFLETKSDERIVKQVLQILLRKSQTFYDIVHKQDASIPELYSILEKLEKSSIISKTGGKIKLTKEGKMLCKEMGIIAALDTKCKFCDGTGIMLDKYFKKLLMGYEKLTKDRPKALAKYDQGYISVQGIVTRIAFMHERGELSNSKIFVCGDDDLMSIALGLTQLPKKIVAIDIDKRLINFINKTSEKLGLNVEAFEYDLREKPDNRIRKSFDVFVTDPVETIPGIKIFLSRCAESLQGKGCSGYFGLTALEASRKKWFHIEEMLLKMGFVITDIKRKFNVYPFEERNHKSFESSFRISKKLSQKGNCDWYHSSFFRVEAISEPKPLIKGKVNLTKDFYFDDEAWATSEELGK
ncbi:MAG: bis-aminopropyl spermidine synthase family protein [Candidatus Diapherotrites archaeon]